MKSRLNTPGLVAGRWRTPTSLPGALAMLWMCFSQYAGASLYFQDGINYSPGTVLGNDAPWTSPQGAITVASGSLTYSNLPPIAPGTNMILVSSNSSSVYSYAPLGSAATNGNVYLSFTIKYNVFSSSITRAGLLQSGNTPAALVTASDPLDMVDNSVSGGFKLGIRAKGSTSSYVTNSYSPLRVGTTYLVVLRYKFADGSASMWVNPPVGGAEPASADATSVTGGGIVSDLSYVYFRAASAAPGYLVDNIQVGSTWQDVTGSTGLAGQLAFAAQPATAIAGNTLFPVTVQLQDGSGNNLASNNVPVTLTLNGGSFASGTTTVNTGPAGLATYNDLVIDTAGNYTLGASASGFSYIISSNLLINPAAIDHYGLTVPSFVSIGTPFTVTGLAQDVYSNTVTTNNSTVVTLGSTANVVFDGNKNGNFGEAGDNSAVLTGGAFTVSAEDNLAQTVSITATDANNKTGASAPIVISSNAITAQGFMLLSFLNSLRVDQYWLVGTSVNFLTGAPGGSGTNMTLGTDSHCSAFAAAAAELLGVYMLRPPAASDLNLANHQADYFVTNTDGWFAIPSYVNAQHMVNTGLLVAASYQASSGSGHIAILRPSTRTDADVTTYGPEECQSGDFNFYDTNVVTGFNQHPGAFPNNIKYYGHTLTYPINPVLPVINQGVITNQTFKSTVTSFAGRKYQVQWSTNLTTWSPLFNFTNPNTPPSFFTNAALSDSSFVPTGKFYRVLAQ